MAWEQPQPVLGMQQQPYRRRVEAASEDAGHSLLDRCSTIAGAVGVPLKTMKPKDC